MRQFVRGVLNHPRYGEVSKWGKLFAITGGAQVIVQATGLLGGILIIRLLAPQEYAFYTIANTMLATMTILADAGITTGVMSEASKVWEDKRELGVVLATGFKLRKKFAFVSLVVSVPVLAYMLIHHGASLLNVTFTIVCLVPAFIAALSDSIYEIVPKLHQEVKALQKNQLSVSIGRLLLSGILLVIYPITFLAILANALPRIYGNLRLKALSRVKALANQEPDKNIEQRIVKIVKLSLPGLIYYCLSGQLNIWLISVFGKTESVATIGALGRLSMITSVFGSVMTILIVPRFARLKNDKSIVTSAFMKIQTMLIGVCALILLVVWLAGTQVLLIIGSSYIGLEHELFLSMLGSCVVLLVGGTYLVYSTKGWIMHPVQSISVSVISIIIGVLVFDVTTLNGVLYLNILVATIEYINHLLYSIAKIKQLKIEPDSLMYKGTDGKSEQTF